VLTRMEWVPRSTATKIPFSSEKFGISYKYWQSNHHTVCHRSAGSQRQWEVHTVTIINSYFFSWVYYVTRNLNPQLAQVRLPHPFWGGRRQTNRILTPPQYNTWRYASYIITSAGGRKCTQVNGARVYFVPGLLKLSLSE